MNKTFYTLKAKSRPNRESADTFKEFAEYELAEAHAAYFRYPPGDAQLTKTVEEDVSPTPKHVIKVTETMTNFKDSR